MPTLTLSDIQAQLDNGSLKKSTHTLKINILNAITNQQSEIIDIISKKNRPAAHQMEESQYANLPLYERVKKITAYTIRQDYNDSGARELYEAIIALPEEDQANLRSSHGDQLPQFLLCALILEYVDGEKLGADKSMFDNVKAMFRRSLDQAGVKLDRHDKLSFLVYVLKELPNLHNNADNIQDFSLEAYQCCAEQLAEAKDSQNAAEKSTTCDAWINKVLTGENTITIFRLFPEALTQIIFQGTSHLEKFSNAVTNEPSMTSALARLNFSAKKLSKDSTAVDDYSPEIDRNSYDF